jgi:hypothetical protein
VAELNAWLLDNRCLGIWSLLQAHLEAFEIRELSSAKVP